MVLLVLVFEVLMDVDIDFHHFISDTLVTKHAEVHSTLGFVTEQREFIKSRLFVLADWAHSLSF